MQFCNFSIAVMSQPVSTVGFDFDFAKELFCAFVLVLGSNAAGDNLNIFDVGFAVLVS